mmetsp:Transcript_95191/g.296344  ORF Transcript_95191/g.296344 Transcript_95191/m.296344 type:complete len:204 (-) Transcript_95191:469-1080(-)
MQRCSRTSLMNFTVLSPPEWLSQQHPFTTWFSCNTRKPEPIGGACEKTKIFQPSWAGWLDTMSSNHLSWASSMVTSCDVYLALRKTVEQRPTRRVFSATWRQNCGVGFLWMRKKASKLASSVLNSSMPSRSWLPPITSYGKSKEDKNSLASSWHSVVPAKSSRVSLGRTDFDSPKSPRLTRAAPTFGPRCSSMMALMCSRPVW